MNDKSTAVLKDKSTDMLKDKALEELFLAQRPVFDDQDVFMARLARKLDAVEYLRQYEEANLRRYRYAMVGTFAMGVVVGAVMLTVILSMPKDVPLITFNATTGILLLIEQYSRMVASLAIMLLLGFGIVSIINNILDITQMRLAIERR